MIIALLASLLSLVPPPTGAQAPQSLTKKVDLAQIALSFECPTAWQVTPNKKAEVHILLPVPDTQASATLDIYPINFTSEPNIWQLSQQAFSQQLKREIVRQWQEEILGVPLLLTRVNYTEKGIAHSSVTGLLYSEGPRKMMYRLESAPEDFDKADYAWRSSMQSLRTFTNRPLAAQVPGKNADPKDVPIIPDRPPTVINLGGGKNGARPIKKADKSLDVTVANRKVTLRYPGDWTLEQVAGGGILLKNPNVANPVKVSLLSTLDSDLPQRAMFKASSDTLNDYVKVERRDEPPMAGNLAGSQIGSVWRRGTGNAGPLTTCDGYVSAGDFYALLSFRSTDPVRSVAERKLVETLLDELSVESPAS